MPPMVHYPRLRIVVGSLMADIGAPVPLAQERTSWATSPCISRRRRQDYRHQIAGTGAISFTAYWGTTVVNSNWARCASGSGTGRKGPVKSCH